MESVKQILPNHADHISYYKRKYIEEMLNNEDVISQYKYDGERMLIHINRGHIYCTSRRISTKTGLYQENQDKIPILYDIFKDLIDNNIGYTVIDCECYSKDWSTAVGILHSLPERAIELQKENHLMFACFDCLFFDDVDIREDIYGSRLYALSSIVNHTNSPYLHLAQRADAEVIKPYDKPFITNYDDIEKIRDIAISKGFEGIVLKSLNRKYYDKGACLKCKKFETVDVVICGYQEGNGKYTNNIGALEIGYYENEKVHKIGKVNCGTDAEREFFNQHRVEMLNTVVEVKCQEITDKSLRHPVFIRMRPDKDYKICTRDTIFKN